MLLKLQKLRHFKNMLQVITGVTATGKTAYALKLAKKINGEIISVDSRQIYKGLDIITGKDLHSNSKFNLLYKEGSYEIGYYLIDNIKIWLYDVISPKEYMTAFDFSRIAQKVIADIKIRGKTPILVGGSFFYLKALLYESLDKFTPANLKFRKELSAFKLPQLQEKLKELDFSFFNSLNNSEKNNPHRLIRKIELLKKGYKFNKKKPEKRYDFEVKIFTHSDSYKAKEVIENRVKNRVQNGAIWEFQSLLQKGYKLTDPGLNTIGCKQINLHINGKISLDELIENWTKDEIAYSKRQKTGSSLWRDYPSREMIPIY